MPGSYERTVLKHIDIKAIMVGCLADWLGTFAFVMLLNMVLSVKGRSLGISGTDLDTFMQGYFLTTQGLAVNIVFGFAFTCLGGYVTARLSPQKNLLNPAFVGSLGILLGLFLGGTSTSLMMNIIGYVFSIPAAVFGGYLHTKKWTFF